MAQWLTAFDTLPEDGDQFPTPPSGSSQPSVRPAPGNQSPLYLSLALHSIACMYTHTHTHTDTHTQTHTHTSSEGDNANSYMSKK